MKYLKICLQSTLENCYYRGSIRRAAGSRVAVRTCDGVQGDGIQGVLYVDNTTYVIQPLMEVDTGNEVSAGFLFKVLQGIR